MVVTLAATLSLVACAPAMKTMPASVSAPAESAANDVLPAGTMTGMIAAYNGQAFVPVVGATIRLAGTDATTVTDAQGHYSFSGVKPGDYQVSASKDGFQSATSHVVMNPVMGTPRVNLALAPTGFHVSAIAPFTATVSGVVTDPRGAALPNANVRVLSNAANSGAGSNSTVVANANGFYTVSLSNVAVSPSSPGVVQASANGTSPGNVHLESSAVAAAALTGTALVLNVPADTCDAPGSPTWPNGTFAPANSPATLNSTPLSTRADEFYIELKSGSMTYDVLPSSVDGAGNVTFRIPYTMPSPTFTAAIVPFGVSKLMTAWSATPFVTQYTSPQFNSDVSYSPDSVFASSTTGVTNLIGGKRFYGTNTGTYSITLKNANPSVSQDIKLSGTVLAGTTIASATASATAIPLANISQPDGSGNWSIQGFGIPASGAATPGQAGKCALLITFKAPLSTAQGTKIQLSNLAVAMPSAGYSKTSAPATPSAITVDGLDMLAADSFGITKSFSDAGSAGDGDGLVTITITPGSKSTGLGEFRVVDTSKTNMSAAAQYATITGTQVEPAAGTQLGLTTADKLVIDVDGGAGVTVPVFSNSVDLENLCGEITNFSGLSGKIKAFRDSGNHFVLQHLTQGTSSTIEIDPATTANMLTVLGVTSGTPVAGTNGVLASFTSATASQPGGTNWTIVPATITQPNTISWSSGTGTIQNSDGSVTAAFSVKPPASYAGTDGPTKPLTITYHVKETGGALTLGPGAGLSSAGFQFGALVSGINYTNYADTTVDVPMSASATDGVQQSNL
ncbi:MAG TPA: carboxypeptidase-like regulatory domain-containing protein [Oscillatoriaceae cyanobacterium]